jgi:hypothetical protein
MPVPKKRSTRRKRRCIQRKIGRAKQVFVLYEIGGPESPKIQGVFNTLEETKKKVESTIGELNTSLEEDRHFKMDVRPEEGMLAWSESEPNAFYVKEVPFYEN